MSQAGVLDITSFNPRDPLIISGDTGFARFVLNNINLVGGPGVEVDGDDIDTLTIKVTAAAFDWTVVTSASNPNSIVKENGYIPKGGSSVTFVLPATAAIGDAYRIVGYGNLWTLTQNAGQSVILGSQTTTVGVGGSVTATMASDTIELICVTANTEFKVLSSVGNLTIV